MNFDVVRDRALQLATDVGTLAMAKVADVYSAVQTADWAPYGAPAASLLVITVALGAMVRAFDQRDARQRGKASAN